MPRLPPKGWSRPPRGARAIEALRPDDMQHEFGMKQAEERIARAKGEEHAAGARWMLRRLRHRLFSWK